MVITDTVTADYIVLNADTIAASTILGFGHKTGTYEVTFFHDMPIGNVAECDGKQISTYKILSKAQILKLGDRTKEDTQAKKLVR